MKRSVAFDLLFRELMEGYFVRNAIRDFSEKRKEEIEELALEEREELISYRDECLEEIEYCPEWLIT